MRWLLVRGQSLPTRVTGKEMIRLRGRGGRDDLDLGDDVGVEEDVDDANEDEDVLFVMAVAEVVTDDESPSSFLSLATAREIFLLDGDFETISFRGRSTIAFGFGVRESEAMQLLPSP
jgi:hypothetical protein